MEAQAKAAGALLHLSSLASAQTSIVERNGIALLVALLDSERLCAANNAAGALWQVASTAAAKGAIIKAGGLTKLVALLLRTDSAEAKEPIAALLADLARTGHPSLRPQQPQRQLALLAPGRHCFSALRQGTRS